MTEDIFNVRFSGEYRLLKWIVKKYKDELPYGGEIMRFAYALPYGKSISFDWETYGVPSRVWNSLHKDLTIAALMNKIDVANLRTLQELKKEYEDGGHNIKIPKEAKAPKVKKEKIYIAPKIKPVVRLVKVNGLVKDFIKEID